MGWPQITMIVLIALGVGISLAKHGEPRGNHSFGASLFSAALSVGLLYAGGFFGA